FGNVIALNCAPAVRTISSSGAAASIAACKSSPPLSVVLLPVVFGYVVSMETRGSSGAPGFAGGFEHWYPVGVVDVSPSLAPLSVGGFESAPPSVGCAPVSPPLA